MVDQKLVQPVAVMPVLLDHLALFFLREFPVHVVLFLKLVCEQRRVAVVSYCLIYHKICLRPFKTQTYNILNRNKDKFQGFLFSLTFVQVAVIRFRHFDMVPEIGERTGLRIEGPDVFVPFSDAFYVYPVVHDFHSVFADTPLYVCRIYVYSVVAEIRSAEFPDVFFLIVFGVHFPALGRNRSVYGLVPGGYDMLAVLLDFVFNVRAVWIVPRLSDCVQVL